MKRSIEIWRSFRSFIIAAIVLLAVAYAATSYFTKSISRQIQSELDRRLTEINNRLGFTIQYGGLKYGLVDGLQVNDLVISSEESLGKKPLLEIPRVTVSYSILVSPSFHIYLNGFVIDEPQFHLSSSPGAISQRLSNLSKDDQTSVFEVMQAVDLDPLLKRDTNRFLRLRSDMSIKWNNGTLRITNESSKGKEIPHLSHLNGQLHADLEKKIVSFESQAQFANGRGQVGFSGQVNGELLQITLTANKLGLAILSPYFPKIFQTTEKTILDGRWTLELPSKSLTPSISFESELSDFGLYHWRLSDQPIQNIHLETSGTVKWDVDKKQVKIEKLRFGNSGAYMNLTGLVDYAKKPKIETHLSIQETPLQKILEALPQDFISVIYDAKVAGLLKLDLDFALDLAKPRKLKLEPKIDIRDYQLVASPQKADIKSLKKEFRHVVSKKGEVVDEFMVGPSNKKFVPYRRLGKNVIRGVLTCEDGSFFRHEGFSMKHIREALVQDIRDKRFTRGASTISMQTAKNLFLSGTKNLSRKFQEILIAYALEQELDKKRILEIYMNIIEWGPKLYGIGPAARHYYYKSPSKLSPVEAAFLGSIIANPKKYHYMYSRGEVTESWSEYLAVIVSKMNVEDDELVDESFQPEFGWVRKKRETAAKNLIDMD